jgi:hypothetical protein
MTHNQREHLGNVLIAALVTFLCGLLAASFLWYCGRAISTTPAAGVTAVTE